MLITYLVGVVLFMALDFVWLGLLMNGFYKRELGSHVSVVNGSIHITYPPTVLFYLLAVGGILLFVLQGQATTGGRALLLGAALGFLVYGSYDLTNAATLTSYSWRLVFADVAWGTVAMALVSFAMNATLAWLA